MSRKLQIAVIGGRDADENILRLAEETGREIARRKAVLVCGGMGGVMEAACRGAKSCGGETVGILPGPHAGDANPFVDVVIPTGMGVARNALVVGASDGAIAVGGRYGTLSEIAFALQKGIPVVSLESWEVDPLVLHAETAREAVDLVLSKIGGRHSASRAGVSTES